MVRSLGPQIAPPPVVPYSRGVWGLRPVFVCGQEWACKASRLRVHVRGLWLGLYKLNQPTTTSTLTSCPEEDLSTLTATRTTSRLM